MATGKKNTVSLEQWKLGMHQLKQLDCSFAAFYGAEPLADFDKLPEVINYAELLGIKTTVITSGFVKNTAKKLRTLYDFGLRSLTVSYDMISLDMSSRVKTRLALNTIERFRSFGDVRDVAVVATLTKKNFKYLPETIKEMSEKGIWTFFDLIHADRKQPGSKVKNTEIDLMFSSDDLRELAEVLNEVIDMKKRGYLCHASEIFMKHIIDSQNDIYNWNCANADVFDAFPSWVTVDCDGIVYPCDDFQPKLKHAPVHIWELADKWNYWNDMWFSYVLCDCPGCCWNTHIDAHAIKNGLLPLTDYIHGVKS